MALTLVSNVLSIIALVYLVSTEAQQGVPPANPQLSSFNSSFSLADAQIDSAGFSPSEAASINNVIRFERSQFAGGPSSDDTFYNLPPIANVSSLQPGTILKIEDATNITNYSLPPNLSLSRILYVSLTLNSTIVPVSAYVLWPFTPRQFSTPKSKPFSIPLRAPVVLWTHPTSGFISGAAPSAHRTLFAGQTAPFALALEGYAVVAPDYAGLGVARNFYGAPIAHNYLASPASANDALYGLSAARAAFSDRFAESFVALGHSQGGGVAWAVAELAARRPDLARGFRGAVAVSPTTDVFGGVADFIAPWVGAGLGDLFPEFRLQRWVTDFGVARTETFTQVGGGLATSMAWFTSRQAIAKQGYEKTWEANVYARLANAGRKRVRGPLLVVQGTEDVFVKYATTSETVRDTCKMLPQNRIEYLVSNGTGHVPTLYATRTRWMRWIEERFEGKETGNAVCGARTDLESFLPLARYQATGNSFVQWAGAPQFAYEVPLAL